LVSLIVTLVKVKPTVLPAAGATASLNKGLAEVVAVLLMVIPVIVRLEVAAFKVKVKSLKSRD
jgi:hypothetical protein